MLTTRCPHCSKVFRVRPEQLSVRGGRVRCGHCQQAFSALAHLEEFDDEDIASPPRPLAQPPVSPPASSVPAARAPAAAAPVKPAAEPRPEPVAPAQAPKPLVPARPAEPVRAPELAKSAPPVRPVEAAKPVAPVEAPKPVQAPKPPEPAKPVPPPKPLDPPRPAAPAARPVPVPRPPVADPAFVRNAPIPLHESSPLTKLPEIAFPSLDLPPESEQPAQAPAFLSLDEKAEKVEAPAVGDDFSMHISMPGEEDEAPASASGTDGDRTEPYRSKVAEELGVGPYEPSRELDMGQTVMLEEALDVIELRPLHNGPESLFEERERQRSSHVGVEDRRRASSGRTAWLVGALALSVLILLQLAYVFRMELARAVPELRPPLEQACALLGCSVPYPRNAELISLEGHSFNPEDGTNGSYRLVLTLLNKAAYPQTWPHVELTITDRFDIAISRRVLKPEEWLPAGQRQQPAFESHAEITANLALNIGELPAAGYRLYVFYP